MNALKTLPAPVAPAQGIYKKGKALLGFYKTGLYNVWGNYKMSRKLCQEYNAKTPLELIAEYQNYRHLNSIHHQETSLLNKFTREDLLTLVRTPPDALKIPGFALILLVFFEFTPLILLLFPRCSPSTCYSQGFRSKLKKLYSANRTAYANLRQSSDMNEATSVHALTRGQLVGLGKTVFPGSPLMYQLAPSAWLKSRLLQHLQFIRADDYFLRSNNLNELVDDEVERACRDRALDIDCTRQDQQQKLEQWAKSFVEPADIGFFGKHH